MKPKEILNVNERKNLTESEARQILEHYHINTVKGEAVESIPDALKIADKIGYPVVLKVISKDIIHKTDTGGVILDVKNEKEMTAAYTKMLGNIKNKFPKAKIDGFFVQEMIKEGYEFIIGGKHDETFGPVVMLGFGGIFVEIFDDVSFRVAPVTKDDVMDMIDEIKAGKILKGFRGRKPANINSIVDIMFKVSKIMLENSEIKELDINPVLITENKVTALDARIMLK